MGVVEVVLGMSAAVLRANALRLPLADASVDLIVTSPPYFALRSYRDEGEHYEHQIGSEETPQAFLEALWAVTAECWRVLKPSGSMWVNLGDKYAGSGGHNNSGVSGGPSQLQGASQRKVPIAKATRRNAPDRYVQASGGVLAKSLLGLPWRYAIGCIDGQAAPDGQRWILRAEVIWSKPNGLPESVTDRVRRSHEQWFHLVKSPRYFAAVDEVREPHSPITLAVAKYVNKGVGDESGNDKQSNFGGYSRGGQNPLGKLPGSVWTIPSEPLLIPEAVQRHYDLPDHFAAFPQELPRRIILGWSPSGICLECGEGRRPVVAKELHGLKQNRVTTIRDASRGDASGSETLDQIKSFAITGYACVCWKSHHTDPYGNIVMSPPTKPSIVLDPFGGTGTVAMVARTLGRFGISVDLSADYNRLAKWRIWESGHGEKAAQRTHRENQGDLFGNAPAYEDVATEAL